MPSFRRWRSSALQAGAESDAVSISDVALSQAAGSDDNVADDGGAKHLGAGKTRSAPLIRMAPKPQTASQGAAASKSKAGPMPKVQVRAAGRMQVKPAPKPKAEPRWGRCGICQRALIVKLRRADGNPFLSCPRWPSCTFAASVPHSMEHLLPDFYVLRRPVLF